MILTRVVAGLVVGLAVVAGGPGRVFALSADGPAEAAGHAEDPGGQGSHGSGNTNPLEWKKDLALFTGVVFLVLFALLWKFAWGPIAQGLQRREQGIADQIAQAEQSNQQAKGLLGQYEQKLAGAKQEVRGMLDQARRDAEQAGREMIDQARQEAQAEQQRALQQIDAATANAIKELAGYSADLAVELAGKIVRAELKSDDHAVLIQQTMADFARRAPSTN